MPIRNHVLLFAAAALLAACSGQTATTSSESTAPVSEAVTAAPASEDAAGSEGATTTGMGSYSLDEVAIHATKEDCWTAIDGVVYDVTKFVSSHPGGEGSIISLCGKDGTDGFNGQHGSDDQAKSKLKSFEIGVLSS